MGGKASPPPPPDYAAAAREQGAANKEVAQYTEAVNRPTEVDPYGQRNWSLKPGADPDNPKPGDWVVETKLNEGQQKLYDMDVQNSTRYGETAGQAINRVQKQLGSDFDMSQVTDRSQIKLPNSMEDFEADRNEVQDALYRRQTRYLDDVYDKQEDSTRARLASQGLATGNRAYQTELSDFNRDKSMTYQDAVDKSITGADASQSQKIANLLQLQAGQTSQRQNDIQTQAYLRQLPLNEANALRTGSQVTGPAFNQWNAASGFEAAPVFDAAGASYSAALASFNAKEAQRANTISGITDLAGAATGGYTALMGGKKK